MLKIHWLESDKYPKAEPTLENFQITSRGFWEYSRLSNLLFCLSIVSSIISFIGIIWLIDKYYELFLS